MADAPAVNFVKDFDSVGDFEKKHTPFITLEPSGDRTLVNIEVGHLVPHPQGADHFIGWIELLANGSPIVRFDLSPDVTFPRFCVPVVLPAGTVLRAIESCNLHGLWAYEATI
jgi:superoxide reductase